MAEDNINPLDPLGPEFGKINPTALDSRSMSPFEGDNIQPPSINFPESKPIIANFNTLTSPHFKVIDGEKENASAEDFATGLQAKLRASKKTPDGNNYAKVGTYNAGPNGNAFYKRYQAYGQDKFNEIGFTPFRNNEDVFNQNTTMADDWKRMLTHSFVPLFTRGFVSGPKSLMKMMQGDFSADTEDAAIYEEAAAIGQSSKDGFGAFMSNTAMSFGYTAGIIVEAIAEEIAASALTAATLGGGAPILAAATFNNLRKLKGIGAAVDGMKAVRQTLNQASNINGARKFWNTAGNITNSKVGRFLNPLENLTDAAIGIGKNADNLTGLARVSKGMGKTAGAFYRDIRNINMALSEARLEGGMVENSTYQTLYDEVYNETGKTPTDEMIKTMVEKSKLAGMETLKWNTALIFASNKIVLPNLLRRGGNFTKVLDSKIDDVFTMKNGKVVFERGAKATAKKEATKDGFKYVEKNLKNSLQGFKKQPIRTIATASGAYMKANLMEGVQENLQEVIGQANEKYYVGVGKDKALGTHLFNKGMSELLKDELGGQFSEQGFETFASGFVMGMFGGGLNKTIGGIDMLANKTFNSEKYNEYKTQRNNYGKAVAEKLNDLYSDPKEFFNSRLFNYGEQNQMSTLTETADEKIMRDIKEQSLISQVAAAIDTNTVEYFKDHLSSMKDMSVDEFEEAFGFEKGTGAEAQGKIDSILGKIDNIVEKHKDATERFPNPVDLSKYDKESPEYNQAAILSAAWEEGKKNYVYLNQAFTDTMSRMESISSTILDHESLKNISQTDMQVLFQPERLTTEVGLLESEIESLSGLADPESKRSLAEKKAKLSAIKEFKESYDTHRKYFKRDGLRSVVSTQLSKEGVEVTEEMIDEVLDQTLGKRSDQADAKVNRNLEAKYKKYLKAVAGTKADLIFNEDIDKSFNQLLDFYALSDESKMFVESINLLHDPGNFFTHVEKTNTWMSNLYNNRKDYYRQIVEEQMAAIENNAILNALADKGIYIDMDQFEDYIKNGVYPKEFFNDATKQVIPRGTEKYNEILNLMDRLSVKETEEETGTFDADLQAELDVLDKQMQNELDKLPKTLQKKMGVTITSDKGKPFNIKKVIKLTKEGESIEVKYADSDKTYTFFRTADGLKHIDENGEDVDIKSVKDKFDTVTPFTSVTEAEPSQVAEIKNKYAELKLETIERYNAKKKANPEPVKTITNQTPVEDMPTDLYTELQDSFNNSKEADEALEMGADDTQMINIFKEYVRKNIEAKAIIDAYNQKVKIDNASKQSGEVDEFSFKYNNNVFNTADLSIEDLLVYKDRLNEKIGELEAQDLDPDRTKLLASYNDTFEKLDRLIKFRLIPLRSEKLKKITAIVDDIIEKSKNVNLVDNSYYSVAGSDVQMQRVSNFIERFKSDTFTYAGKNQINTAYALHLSKEFTDENIEKFIARIKETFDAEPAKYGVYDNLYTELRTFLKSTTQSTNSQETNTEKRREELISKYNIEFKEIARKQYDKVSKKYIDGISTQIWSNGKLITEHETKIEAEKELNKKLDALINNTINSKISLADNIFIDGITIDDTTFSVLNTSERMITVADIGGVKVPFYLTTGLGGKNLTAGWYPMFGYSPSGWLNKTDGKDMESFYFRIIGKEASDVLKKVSEKLNNKLGVTPNSIIESGIISKQQTQEAVNSVLNFTPAENQKIDASVDYKVELAKLENNIKSIGEEINAKYDALEQSVVATTTTADIERRRKETLASIKEGYNGGKTWEYVGQFKNQLTDKVNYEVFQDNYTKEQLISEIEKKYGAELTPLEQQQNVSKNKTPKEVVDFISENAYEYTRVAGTYLDNLVRDYFDFGTKPAFDEAKISKEAYENIFGDDGFLSMVKQQIDDGKITVISKDITLYDEESKVAGTIDLLVLDKSGNPMIIDLKTGSKSKWDGWANDTSSAKNKKESYALQQLTYARLFEKMTGIKVKNVGILPVEITIDSNTNKIKTASKPTTEGLIAPGKWAIPLNTAPFEEQINTAIPITEKKSDGPQGMNVGSQLSDKAKLKLNKLGFTNEMLSLMSPADLEVAKTFTSKEEAKEMIDQYSKFVVQSSFTIPGSKPSSKPKKDIRLTKKQKLDELRKKHSTGYPVSTSSFVYYEEGLGLKVININTGKEVTGKIAEKAKRTYTLIPNMIKTRVSEIVLDKNKAYDLVGALETYYEALFNAQNAEEDFDAANVENLLIADALKEIKLNPKSDKLEADYLEIKKSWISSKSKTTLNDFVFDTLMTQSSVFDAMGESEAEELVKDFMSTYSSTADFYKKRANQIKETQAETAIALAEIESIVGLQLSDELYANNETLATFVFNELIKNQFEVLENENGQTEYIHFTDYYNLKTSENDYTEESEKQDREVQQQGGNSSETGDTQTDEKTTSVPEKVTIEDIKADLEGLKTEDDVIDYTNKLYARKLDQTSNEIFEVNDSDLYTLLNDKLNSVTKSKTDLTQDQFAKDDVFIVKNTIFTSSKEDKVFANPGDKVTVLKSNDKSVTLKHGTSQKSLSLNEVNDYITTMDKEELEDTQSTDELTPENEEKVTETLTTFDNVIRNGDMKDDLIKDVENPNIKGRDLLDNILNNLDC